MLVELYSETTLTEISLLGIAFVLSAIIGVERQRKLKSAGLRTHTLVGLGSAVFTLVSAYGFSHVVGTDEEIEAAFERTYEIIIARLQAFLALPLEELRNDKARFKAELDRIGTLVP